MKWPTRAPKCWSYDCCSHSTPLTFTSSSESWAGSTHLASSTFTPIQPQTLIRGPVNGRDWYSPAYLICVKACKLRSPFLRPDQIVNHSWPFEFNWVSLGLHTMTQPWLIWRLSSPCAASKQSLWPFTLRWQITDERFRFAPISGHLSDILVRPVHTHCPHQLGDISHARRTKFACGTIKPVFVQTNLLAPLQKVGRRICQDQMHHHQSRDQMAEQGFFYWHLEASSG